MLKEPPLLEHLLLESPLAITILLAAVGLLLLITAALRRSRSRTIAGIITILIGTAVFAIATLVVTDREHVRQATKDLLAATAPFDDASLTSLFGDEVTIVMNDSQNESWKVDGNSIVDGLKTATQTFPVNKNLLKELEAESVSDLHARSHFVVLSVATRGRIRTRWLLDWEKHPDGRWVVTQIQWLDEQHLIGIAPTPFLINQFFSPNDE